MCDPHRLSGFTGPVPSAARVVFYHPCVRLSRESRTYFSIFLELMQNPLPYREKRRKGHSRSCALCRIYPALLLFPVVDCVDDAGYSGNHREQDGTGCRLVQSGAKEQAGHCGNGHDGDRYCCPEFFSCGILLRGLYKFALSNYNMPPTRLARWKRNDYP